MAGDAVGTADGHAVTVLALGIQAHLGPVYNLEVEGLHTYAVGHDGLLVHNGLRCLPGIPGGLRDAKEAFRPTKIGLLKTRAHARKLRENLKAAGVDCGPNDPHHVVPSGIRRFKAASLARGLLARYKIDFNDAVNGVCISQMLHRGLGLHTRNGIRAVHRRLAAAEKGIPGQSMNWEAKQGRVAKELQQIIAEIEGGTFRFPGQRRLYGL